MNTVPHLIPRVAIRGICGGLILMALFTMVWAGIAQGGLMGSDDRVVLIAFALLALLFVINAVRFFIASKQFPVFTSDEDKAEGKRTSKAFGLIFGIEGAAIPIACGILAAIGHTEFILPAIALIVGLHFYPMAKIFGRKLDYFTGTWATLVAITGIIITMNHSETQQFVMGLLGIGMALTTSTYGVFMIFSGNNMAKKNAAAQ